ncbi:MAG: helix-turn-helix domain-containing protein [Lachnospiraceae bacterium]|nr:helix-turn-helix domain-containing protein [Lachnospiraceae bacterium]
MKSKSLFSKYFIEFMLVLLIPMITIALMFIQARSTVVDLILTSSEEKMNQFFKRVDAVVEEGRDICLNIGSNEECRKYATYANVLPDKTTYQSVILQKFLSNYMSEKYSDIFVYYPIEDKIVSAVNAVTTSKHYYEIYYEKNQNSFWEEFESILNCTSKKPVLKGMNGKNIGSYLCVSALQMSFSDDAYSYVVVLVMKPQYIQELMQEIECDTQEGVSIIYDTNKEVIWSSTELNLDYSTERLGERGTRDVVIEGNTYIMQSQKSDILKAYYAYMVPEAYFWEKLVKLYIICGICGGLCIVLGFVLVCHQSKKAYQPLEQMINNIQEQKSVYYDARINTEFEFIESLFNTEKEEKMELNRSVRKRDEQIERSKFLISLLNGSVKILDNENDIFKKNYVELYSDRFYVIIIQIEESECQMEKTDLTFIIPNVFQELGNRNHNSYVLSVQDNKYVMILNLKDRKNESINSLLLEGKEFMQKYYDVSMTLGISSVKEGLRGVHNAYEEACYALKYRYLLGKESVIEYSLIADRSFDYFPPAENLMYYMITDYLSGRGKNETAVLLVQEIIKNYHIHNGVSLETIECFKIEAISTLNRMLLKDKYCGSEWNEKVKRLIDISLFEDFTSCFSEILEELHEKYQEQSENEDICKRVLEYIDSNYRDPQLSLKLISDKMNISSSYLSRLFKEKYQISIPDYLTGKRIRDAKADLRNSSYGIQEIAERNGFLSDSAFIKIFKKIEGITPGVYRDLLRKQQ